MTTLGTRWQGVALLVVLAGWAAPSALALDARVNNALPAPSSEPRFKPGDTVQVATEGAQLMLGTEVIAELQQGQPIVVVEVQHPWIGTYVLSDNQKKTGWVRSKEFIPVATPAKPQAAACPQISRGAVEQVFVASRSSVDSAYMIGKYDRHELDPNVHTW